MQIDVISVQPKMLEGFFTESILGRAVRKGVCAINLVDLRSYGEGRWKKVDDKPYGGGPGMLMKCGPWFAAVEHCVGHRVNEPRDAGTRVIMTSPKGRAFTQREAESLARAEHLIFLCGHYEGFDARIETLATDVYSVGDFVMTGGELAAAAMVDSIVRLLPGVLGGGPAATASESFGAEGLLEAPQYTHPPEFRGLKVPEVLLSGDHAKIESWRRCEARRQTAALRPDLAPSLNATPRANRFHIAFFGLRNAGKSTLVNAFTGQSLAIVSETPGTTTDPVSKAMEILPLGPCLITDTAGLDDVGSLGAQRVQKTLDVLATTDLAVWVWGEEVPTQAKDSAPYRLFRETCAQKKIPVLEFPRGACVEELKRQIAGLKVEETAPGLLDGLVQRGDRILCVCPIDAAAPQGRLILPQVQVIRAALDRHATCTVCQVEELAARLADRADARTLVITDSQAFQDVTQILRRVGDPALKLTSFSILFARQKGDFDAYLRGWAALQSLPEGATVLIAEGCTHHRQCNDIGSVQIPKALEKLAGVPLKFVFSSGGDFPLDRVPRPALIVQCGGCMLTRREVRRRIARAEAARIPIVNYGMVLAAATGMTLQPGTCWVQL